MNDPAPEHLARKLVADALGCDSESIKLALEAYDIPEWDSIGHMNILIALEHELSVKIEDIDEVERLTSFKAIVEFVTSKLRST